jgi:hypothetical protein
MHPGNLDGLMNWASSSGGVAGATSKALMLDTMLAMFMIGMPVLWTMLMGWAGIRIGRDIESAVSAGTKSTRQAGDSGSKATTQGTKAIRK